VDFADGWLAKSIFSTMDEMKACQLTKTKVQKKVFGFYKNGRRCRL
jgi:hypothetical protein